MSPTSDFASLLLPLALAGSVPLLGCGSDGGPGVDPSGGLFGGVNDAGTAGNTDGAVSPLPDDNGFVLEDLDAGEWLGDDGIVGLDAGARADAAAGFEGAGFPPVSDFAAMGPFATEQGPNPAACTIHRPSTLGEGGRKHPVILWGNGTRTAPPIYSAVLSHWASHGFIVAAANTSNAGSGAEMLACLDYLVEQNAAAGSPFSGHVDMEHIGTSGHSQGGGGSIMAARDARVSVSAPLQPYIGFIPFGGTFEQAAISDQKGPMFLMSGSGDTVAVPSANQAPVFASVNVPVFWGTLQGADHLASATGNISGYRGPSTAWFRLHLMGDESARPLFYGAACELCGSADWVVERKGIN